MKYADMNLKGPGAKREPVNNNSNGNKGLFLIFVVLISLTVAAFIFRDKLLESFNPISVVASVSNAKLKETDGRTNILLLGSDKRSQGVVTSILTDSILIASIGKVDNDVVLISVPRDLWVQSPSGYRTKINAVYTLAENDYVQNGKKGPDGSEELKKTLEEFLGIPIHYYALITFDLFEQAVDIVGGVNVTVDNAFTDYMYPVEGKENAPDNERYQTIHFNVGAQLMDGKTALKFVRSRHGDNGEDTDFARSKRQQKVIAALKDKSLSLQTILDINKIKSLYDAYSGNVTTDIDFATIQTFYLLSRQVDLAKVVSVVLDDRSEANEGGLLYAPEDTTLYGEGKPYVLVPRTGDFSQIHAFVQKYLFGNK